MQLFDIKAPKGSRGLPFKFLTGDVNWQDYGGTFVSARQNNGEFDYWLVIEVMNVADYEDFDCKYLVSLCSISPSEAGEAQLKKAFKCCGLDSDEHAELRANPLVQVECLATYGVKAHLWDGSGNNINALMKEARQQAKMASLLYGFYMDAPQNRIGATGWEFQRGDTYGAEFRKYCAEHSERNEMQNVAAQAVDKAQGEEKEND